MGKAFMPYTRSVQQRQPLPLNRLPDAGLVFDTLLRRQQVRPYLLRVLICTPAH
jgi:linoleate 10R-lipoxygenase